MWGGEGPGRRINTKALKDLGEPPKRCGNSRSTTFRSDAPTPSPRSLDAFREGLSARAGLPVPEAVLALVRSRATERTLPRGAVLDAPDTVQRDLHFLVTGTAEQAYRDSAGRARVTYLWTAGDLVARVRSLLAGQPDDNGILVVRSATVLTLPAAAATALRERDGEVAHFAARLSDYYFAQVAALTAAKTLATPAERYERLLAQRPELAQAFSQARVASLLGMSLGTLLRMGGR